MDKYALKVKVSTWIKFYYWNMFIRKVRKQFDRGLEIAKLKRKMIMCGNMIVKKLKNIITRRYVFEKGRQDYLL